MASHIPGKSQLIVSVSCVAPLLYPIQLEWRMPVKDYSRLKHRASQRALKMSWQMIFVNRPSRCRDVSPHSGTLRKIERQPDQESTAANAAEAGLPNRLRRFKFALQRGVGLSLFSFALPEVAKSPRFWGSLQPSQVGDRRSCHSISGATFRARLSHTTASERRRRSRRCLMTSWRRAP